MQSTVCGGKASISRQGVFEVVHSVWETYG